MRNAEAITELQTVDRKFPQSDQFPLGRRAGRVVDEPEYPTKYRPFGLTLAARPRETSALPVDQLGYDEERQIGVIRAGDLLIPLSRHTDGQTNTVTERGDGQGSNQDSDTDFRED
jgi:putative ATP-grasp target RiPP